MIAPEERAARRYLVSGRVQGVGYRHFAWMAATELSLGGWVRNLGDGRVEAVAEGPQAALDAFERQLAQGPNFARVTDVETQAAEPSVDFELDSAAGFEVRPTQR